MTPAVVVVMLTLLLSIQPISTDLYLPALPTLQREFMASTASAQLTLSALIVCFGFGQLVCGPLADRFGRRPVLLVGMALYTTASLLSAAAQSIDALVIARALQGAAMASAVTCGRSIVRDLYQPHEGARAMSRALGGLGAIALLSPIVGGLLVQWSGWHAAMLMTALYGAGVLAFIALRFEETVPLRDPLATQPARVLRNWRELASHPTFRAWTALLCCSYGGLFVVLAGSSFVYINVLGTSRVAYGFILASNSAAYIAGTVVCRRLLLRHGVRGAVRRGSLFSLAGGLSVAGISLLGGHNVWAVMLPLWLFAFGHGVNQPCAQSAVIGPFPAQAGTAASLSGFAMMVTAFGIGQVLGRTLDDSVYPLTLGVGGFSVVLFIVANTLVQRHGEPAAARATEPQASAA